LFSDCSAEMRLQYAVASARARDRLRLAAI
jgi:hypothetical protein